MTRPAPAVTRMSPEDYLEMESASSVKHKYVGGFIHGMTGTSDCHNTIAGNFYIALRSHLKGSPCRVFMAAMKARLERAKAFYYPDVMVSCEAPANPYCREQPKLIVEVLSTSTVRFDAGAKRRDYQSMPSLEEYVLVSQECMDVRVWRRAESDWAATIYTDGMLIPLASVGLNIPIGSIYEDAWT